MDGYWPSFFFSRSINTQKKRTRPISSHLDQTSLVNKGFIIWDKTPKHDKLYLRDKARIQSGQDRSILPARVANHSARFVHLARSRNQSYNNNIYHSLFTTLYGISDSCLPMSKSVVREVITLFLDSKDVWSKLDTCTFFEGGVTTFGICQQQQFFYVILGDHYFWAVTFRIFWFMFFVIP